LKAKYEEAGIDAEILQYDPLEAFPYYFDNTNETYRSYFRHLVPMLQFDFDGFVTALFKRQARRRCEPSSGE